MSFALTFPAPPSVNGIWKPIVRAKAGRSVAALVKAKPYDTWITLAGAIIATTRPKPAAVHGNFIAEIIVDDRLRDSGSDLDNRIKPVLDLLAHMSLIDNDKFCDDVRARWGRLPLVFDSMCVCVEVSAA